MRRFSAFPSLLVAAPFVLGLTTACGSEADTGTETPAGDTAATETFEVVPAGKTDNFYSSVAAEFEVTGRLPVTMTKDEFNDEAKRQEIVTRRLTAFGLYLTTYMTDKFRGIDSNGDGQISESEIFFRNEGYGSFHAMVRNFSVETLDVSGDPDAGYAVTFSIDVAGPKDLLSIMPVSATAEGGKGFALRMPKNATVDPNSVPRGEIRSFNPDTYSGELETVDCTIAKLPDVSNAYPAYDRFVEDGVYDITLFFGHDYNKSRSDLQEARQAFEVLDGAGFELPVSRFEDLKADSGLFKKQIKANGKDVSLEVRIYHSDMFTTDRKGQHDLAISELVARDVFMYLGHAGPYYGFYLDEAKQATVSYLELANAPFTEKQQLVVAQGCQTYSQYADMLYANAAKSEDNLDVITTVNYSYGQGNEQLIKSLIQVDRESNHLPVDFYTMVGDLNEDWYNSYKDVFYGVMGIDGNPQMHPYASVSSIGEKCETAADCGDPDGNACIAASIGPKQCAAKTLAESACPEGTRFEYLARAGTIATGACLKK